MNKKIIGYIIGILLIGTMVVLMIKPNIKEVGPVEQATKQLQKEGLEKGDIPPDFELSTLTGDVVKLSELKGKKVILNFWASWCGPCKAEMPHMQQYYEKNKDYSNVEVIAVNMTTQERKGIEGIENFVKSYGLTFPIPLDEEGVVIDSYKVMSIPTTYMIGTDGTINHKIIGPMDEKTMEDMVENIE